MSLFFKGGQVASEDGPLAWADVWVEDGVIKALGEGLDVPDGTRVVDAAGKVIAPAMFDAHVHFREPGQ